MTAMLFADWSLKKVFGRMVSSTCSLATTSSVYVDVSSNEVCYFAYVSHIFVHLCQDLFYYCKYMSAFQFAQICHLFAKLCHFVMFCCDIDQIQSAAIAHSLLGDHKKV